MNCALIVEFPSPTYQKRLTLQPFKLGDKDEAQPRKRSQMIHYFIFPTCAPLLYSPKSTRLNKIHITTRKSFLSEISFNPIWRSTIGNLPLENIADYLVWFTMLTNNMSYNPIPHILVPFLLVTSHWQKSFKRERGRWDIQKLRNLKHRVKYRIICYPKFLLIFTA